MATVTTSGMALWACIGRAAEAVVAADQCVKALPALWPPEHEMAMDAVLERAVAAAEDLGEMLAEAGLRDGERRLLRLADGRLFCVALAPDQLIQDRSPFGEAAELPADVVDLRAAHAAETATAARGARQAAPGAFWPIAAVGAVALAVQEEGEGR